MSHPYQLLDELPVDELEALRADIERYGVLTPVLMDDEGRIIDGHHRVRLATELGVEYPVEIRPGLSEREKEMLAVRLNVKRRHMSREARQRKAVGLRERGWTLEEVADALGVSHETVRQDSSTFRNLKVEDVEGKDGKLRPATYPSADELAERRAKVKELRAAGHTVDAIATQLQISAGTVSSDLKHGAVVRTHNNRQAARALESLPHVESLDKPAYDLKSLRHEEKKQHHNRTREATGEVAQAKNVTLINADFREALKNLPNDSVSLIFTDPPYDADSIPLYEDLAREAARVLEPGGSLLAYCGQYAMDRILPRMSGHLRFWWVNALIHSHGNTRFVGKNVFVGWKPVLWFVKEGRGSDVMIDDTIRGDKPRKEFHEWAQGEAEAGYFITHLTQPGDVVVDPFAGSGTTLIAAARLGREAFGCEMDPDRYAVAGRRINESLS